MEYTIIGWAWTHVDSNGKRPKTEHKWGGMVVLLYIEGDDGPADNNLWGHQERVASWFYVGFSAAEKSDEQSNSIM